jgi:putative FmdB family regulatory protein
VTGGVDVPRYDYECRVCSLKFEVKKHFDESVEANCPQCLGEARRLFSPVPIVFKGPGFYVTDNAAENSSMKSSAKREEEKTVGKEKASEKESGKESEPPKDKQTEVMV